ncbi:MAG TPA: O-antigen ligase family protein [Rhizomicrobium sp.]|nr:O-antigen ligase family protein [Rhizomicrobium sp.]
MASEGFAPAIAPVRANLDTRIAEAGFVLLLLLTLVGLTPFDARNPAAIAARDAASAAGDLVRQVTFLGTFLLIAFAAVRIRGIAILRAVPPMLGVLLAWCLLSALWSSEPEIVARRGVLAAIFVMSMLFAVDTLGTTRTLALWRWVLAAIIVADIASVFLVHQAVHLPDDVEPGLAGAWRGLHSHKNAAGAVAATATMVFFFFALESRRRSDTLLCLASLFFLVMTRSKSSLGLLPVALVAGGLYRFAWRNTLDRAIAGIVALLALLAAAVLVTTQWDMLARFLEDPQQFTGRAAIWAAELDYIRDHPLLGAGFGSFGNTGVRSPIYHYVGPGWVSQIGEGHSGYLEMIVTIGGIGFLIGMLALVVLPFLQFWRPERRDANFNALLFALFAFDILHNFMESDFITVTSVQWGLLLMVIALLRVSQREMRAREAVP